MHALYTIEGIVKHGAQRGTAFGYPTANVSISAHIPEGVYAAKVTVDDKTYNAATFIGSAPTFGDAEYKSESYILDFKQDIYNKKIIVKLYKKLRGRMSFSNEEDLKHHMQKDIQDVRAFLKNTD